MSEHAVAPAVRRRSLLLVAAGAFASFATHASAVCTPRDLAQRYAAQVERSLVVPGNEVHIYGALAENELAGLGEPALRAPQYLLVVDSCPAIQVAFLFWRMLPGHLQLVGASPASTGDPVRPGCVATPCGVFSQAEARAAGALASRVYDFGVRRVRMPGSGIVPMHLRAQSAQGRSRSLLGRPQSDGRVLLPPSLVAFLDAYRVLDGAQGDATTASGEVLPFAGRSMVVLDSEREDRPGWTAA